MASIAALIATILFALIVLAAAVAILLRLRDGSTCGSRALLIGFLAFSCLVGALGLASTRIKAGLACQAFIYMGAAFDLLARIMMEQHALWSVRSRSSRAFVFLQLTVVLRFATGAVWVGSQRPQSPVCTATLARSTLLPVGAVVAGMDSVLVLSLLAMAIAGQGRGPSSLLAPSGLAIWTGLSIPMFLGIESGVIFREVLPSIGLLLVIGASLFLDSVDTSEILQSELRRRHTDQSRRAEIMRWTGRTLDKEADERHLIIRNREAAFHALSRPSAVHLSMASRDFEAACIPNSLHAHSTLAMQASEKPGEMLQRSHQKQPFKVNITQAPQTAHEASALPVDLSRGPERAEPTYDELRRPWGPWIENPSATDISYPKEIGPGTRHQPTEDEQIEHDLWNSWTLDMHHPLSSRPADRPWHHRIGEEPPTFSNRRRHWKTPPPTPLLLCVPLQEASASAPRGATDGVHKHLVLPDENARATLTEQQRMAILTDLESEMGAQEVHWHALREELLKASPYTETPAHTSSPTTETDASPATSASPSGSGGLPLTSVSSIGHAGETEASADDKLLWEMARPLRPSTPLVYQYDCDADSPGNPGYDFIPIGLGDGQTSLLLAPLIRSRSPQRSGSTPSCPRTPSNQGGFQGRQHQALQL